MTGYDYGNARLRARKSRFLGANDYRTLLGSSDLDGLIGLLSGTWYGPAIEAALPRFESIRRLDAAVANHLGRILGEVASFYLDTPARAIALLLERWDLKNVRVVLRGVAGRSTPSAIQANLAPVGTIAPAILRTLTSAPDLRSLLDLMMSLGVPERRRAVSTVRSWAAYEQSGDPAVLELALHLGYATHWQEELAELGLAPMSRLFRREADTANVMAALRAFGHHDDDPVEVGWLPGSHDAFSLLAASNAASREEAVAALAQAVTPAWVEALNRWTEHGDTTQLADDLETLTAFEMVRMFTTGDPLGIEIPIAFVVALETEARNVRLVGRTVASGRASASALDELVVPL